MPDNGREHITLKAVQLYYYEGLTQAAIADRLGCTRWTVGRLLKEAVDSGMVKITVNHPHARRHDLEILLRRTFDLAGVRVVPTQSTASATMMLVAQSAADFLTGLRPAPQTMGFGWGRTTAALARAMPDKWAQGVRVVQIHAAPAMADDSLVTASIGLLAKRGRGVGQVLTAPAIAADVNTATRIKREPVISSVFNLGRNADVHVFSPGIISEESLLFRGGYLTSQDVESAKQAGGSANIVSHLVDHAGNLVLPEIDKRTIAIDIEALKHSRFSVAMGSGKEKYLPLFAAVNSKLANTLIVDSQTAEEILAMGE